VGVGTRTRFVRDHAPTKNHAQLVTLPTKKAARIIGFLYLLVVIAGPFLLLYVPGKLFVPGDASATAAKILAHESLFRTSIVIGLISELVFIAVVVGLYYLLKGVNQILATAMVLLILIQAPLAFLGTANEVATLAFLRDAHHLSAFDGPQRDAIVMLLIGFDHKGLLVSELFWGLWLLPLGILVYRSWFIPRLLGAWLFVNGLAYIAISFTGILAPDHSNTVFTLSTPLLFGEMALMFWLLVFGVRARTPAVHAPLAT